ncbi:MAG: N-acetyltransferase [Desulfobulbaceae bacterium]|nr:MAG: N-acetyltransferase [Desulfobulbaceae bacterium]
MTIRLATIHDKDQIYQVHYQAFSAEERNIVAELGVNLLSEKTTPPILSLVAEIESKVVGHIAFSPLTHQTSGPSIYLLGPLGILPEYQRQSIGTRLIQDGIKQLKKQGVDVLIVYGDPAYYTRFGFNTETAINFLPPYKLEYPFGWLAMDLSSPYELPEPIELGCVQSLADPKLW